MRKRQKKPGKREIRSASTGNPAAKSRSQPAGNVGLTKEEKKRLRQLREKKAEQKKKKIPFTAQETLPYKEIYRDGICQTEDRFFSKTIQFFDINYQLAKNDDKTTIFENYCEFLNYFDSSVRFQITFLILTSSFFLTQSFKFNNQTGNYPNLLTLFGVPDFFPA